MGIGNDWIKRKNEEWTKKQSKENRANLEYEEHLLEIENKSIELEKSASFQQTKKEYEESEQKLKITPLDIKQYPYEYFEIKDVAYKPNAYGKARLFLYGLFREQNRIFECTDVNRNILIDYIYKFDKLALNDPRKFIGFGFNLNIEHVTIDKRIVSVLKIVKVFTDEELDKEDDKLKEVREQENNKTKKTSENIKWNVGDFILDESLSPQSIDHALGIIKIKDKYFRYYGCRLEQGVEKKNKKETYRILEKVESLLLEDGSIISKYKKPQDLEFNFNSILSSKINRLSLNTINSFTSKQYNPQNYSFFEVFKTFKGFYDYAMVYDDTRWYLLNPIWDMCTYYWDIIDKFLIIKHGGISGSAKSKGMKISRNLSFNGITFVCPTPANFFRYRHNNKATICIEEAERLFSENKHDSNDSVLVEYLNASYEKGNVVPRQNDKNLNETEEFDPCGFLRIGAIKPLKGALEKRSVTLNMVKAGKIDNRGNVEVPSPTQSEYQKARDKAYICGLLNYKLYQQALNDVENRYGLVDREWNIAKPLIAMARCIDQSSTKTKLSDNLSEKVSEVCLKVLSTLSDTSDNSDKNIEGGMISTFEYQIGSFLTDLFEIRDESAFDEGNWNRILCNCLIELSMKDANNKIPTFISNDTLMNKFKLKTYSNLTTHGMNSILSTIGFGGFYGKNSKGDQRGYTLHFDDVCKIVIRQEILKIDDIINITKKVSEVSEVSVSEDKIKKWYSDTFQTNNNINKVCLKEEDNEEIVKIKQKEVDKDF